MIKVTAREAHRQLAALVEYVVASHQPIFNGSGSHGSILLSQQDWDAIHETLQLLSVPGLQESIKESMAAPVRAPKH